MCYVPYCYTNLKGAVIASTDKAIRDGRNSLTTETLTVSNIQNKAEYEGEGSSATIGYGAQGGLPQLSGAGVGSDSGDAESITLSAVSQGTVSITDNEVQQNLTGKDATTTVALLNRDVHVNEQGEAVDSQGNSTAAGITPIFDAEKVQKEIQAQVQITQAFSQQAGQAVSTYVQTQKQTLREAYKNATIDAERAAIQAQFDDLILQGRVMNVLISAVTGLAGPALAQETLSLTAAEMHRISVENSMRSAGFVDAYGNVVTNLRPGEENKLLQDIDLGGTRLDPDGICGLAYERCNKQENADGTPILDTNGKPQLAYNDQGRIQFTYEPEGQKLSIYDFLDNTDESKKMHGLTGGIQGGTATFAGYTYPSGRIVDQVIKAFGGTHDFIGGQVPGLYDDSGDTRQGMTEAERTTHNTWSAVAIIPSAPFAMAQLLPPEMWKAISVMLEAAK